MGDPKKQRKKYEKPKFPWRSDILQTELRLIGQYGLRNKRELWRHRTTLSKYRGIARSILGMSDPERGKLEKQIINKLSKGGFLSENVGLDAVLDLSVEDVLERRLQTVVFRKGLSNSIYQARQLIAHRHIAIEGKRVHSPGYMVLKVEEEKIAYAPTSPFSNKDHPLREALGTTVEKNE